MNVPTPLLQCTPTKQTKSCLPSLDQILRLKLPSGLCQSQMLPSLPLDPVTRELPLQLLEELMPGLRPETRLSKK